ncbi:MucR family transcriptional regulator [Methylobacterium sp. NEAU K]|uniref:MucR family transcriptional regulator n=1 Tax=Methylobacterium sp. NEAU K TaxID=3064946 RepID=UPI00273626CF|nr:MucR family transcriptional regulator [Methylobacterium sp. NEAU K]MDP4002265.1 MucR family transcriptional regulator [Methylobacterium sp. NEAU K]
MSEIAEAEQAEHIELAVDIVAAYVSNNSVPSSELPGLISGIHAALNSLSASGASSKPAVEKLSPAQIRKSITPDHIVSFEDGKPYKTLRRHLTLRGLSPEAYREKWGLPRDYPMTAASYSAQRSELARALGLGQQRRKSRGSVAPPVQETPAAAAPKSRGRKKTPAE